MIKETIHNARITNVFIGIEDHGIFSFGVEFDFGPHQGTGLYPLLFDPTEGDPEGITETLLMAKGIMKAMGVYELKNLKGTPCRIKKRNNMIVAIADIVKDNWYEWRED